MDTTQNSIIVQEKNGTFQLYDPHLNIYASGENLQQAYENIATERVNLKEKIQDFQAYNNQPDFPGNPLNRVVPVKYFVIYTLSILFIFTLMTFKLTQGVTKQVHKTVEKLEHKLEKNFSLKPMDENKQREKLKKFEAKMQQYQPFIQSFRKAWEGNAETSNN